MMRFQLLVQQTLTLEAYICTLRILYGFYKTNSIQDIKAYIDQSISVSTPIKLSDLKDKKCVL